MTKPDEMCYKLAGQAGAGRLTPEMVQEGAIELFRLLGLAETSYPYSEVVLRVHDAMERTRGRQAAMNGPEH